VGLEQFHMWQEEGFDPFWVEIFWIGVSFHLAERLAAERTI
jgi:hypothetical protein